MQMSNFRGKIPKYTTDHSDFWFSGIGNGANIDVSPPVTSIFNVAPFLNWYSSHCCIPINVSFDI